MAILHVKTPNGTTKTVDLETMNITSSLQQNGWCKLPNGLIIQWISDRSKSTVESLIALLGCVEADNTPTLCQYFMSFMSQKHQFSYMNSGIFGQKLDMNGYESGVSL